MPLFAARLGIAQQCTRGDEHRPLFSIRAMCRCLCIHPSGFYAWLKSPLSKRAVEDQRQTKLIKEAWEESGKVYGYRKLHDDQGETVCPNRVARLARVAGISPDRHKRRPDKFGGKPSIAGQRMAVWRRKPTDRVLIHSDQGSQFTAWNGHHF